MDAGHYFSGDLLVSATGDLLAVDTIDESQQRILRRLLTNPRDYLWQPGYGAGLPAQIGQPLDENAIDALVRSQMLLEQSVSQNPAPQVLINPIANGLDMHIQYVELDSGRPTVLNFSVTP